MEGQTYTGSSAGATGLNETGLCAPLNEDTADIWFVWTAVCDGDVKVSTCGSNYDTTVAVYEGDPSLCGLVADIFCNDNATGICSPQSQLTFPATTGTDYLIRIGGVGGATGTYSLLLECPGMGGCCILDQCAVTDESTCVNAFGGTYLGDDTNCDGNECSVGACCTAAGCDLLSAEDCGIAGGVYQGNGTNCTTSACPGAGDDCAFPLVVQTGVPFVGDTTNATGVDESSCAGAGDIGDVWHSWTADCTGTITVSTCGSGFDTSLAVFDMCPPGATQLACNDDFCGLQSQLTFDATSGNDYLIRVAGFGGQVGSYTLLVTCPPIGACCIGNELCEIQSQTECTQAGNVYLGNNSSCEVAGLGCATGACCLPNNTCDDSGDGPNCDAAGGQYSGDGSLCATVTCAQFGACCTEGACSQAFANDCIAGGGTFAGAGVACVSDTCHGACCDGNGGCAVLSEGDCDASAGIFFGAASMCGDFVCPGEQFIPLHYNWNGLIHAGEAGQPDAPNGFRSIGDRANTVGNPDSIGGTLANITLGNLTYYFEQRPTPRLDTVHVGFRRDPYDAVPNGDDIGIPPSWDPSVNGDGKFVPTNTTTITPTGPLDATFELGILYNASENGGDFDMTLGFTDASNVTVRFDAADWFANGTNTTPAPAGLGVATQVRIPGPLSGGDGFEATANVDSAISPAGPVPLAILHGRVTRDSLLTGQTFDVVGRRLQSITFDNWSPNSPGNMAAGVGIYAASVIAPDAVGCACVGDVSNDTVVNARDIQPLIDCLLGGGSNCDCADVDGMNGADLGDVAGFVTNLLTANPGCL